MKIKKVLFALILAVGLISVVSLAGCEEDPNAITTTTTAVLDSKVSTLEYQVTAINTDIATIKQNITQLQSTVNGITAPDLSAINTAISDIQTSLTTVSQKVFALETSLGNYATHSEVDVVVSDMGSLKTELDALAIDLDELSEQVDANYQSLSGDIAILLNRVIAIENAMNNLVLDGYVTETEYNTDIDILYANDVVLNGMITTLQTQMASYSADNVNIVTTGWVALSTYQINCKINKTGNYAVVFTIYGDSVDGITINPMVGYEFTGSEKDYTYGGTSKTMRVFILYPDSIKYSMSTTTLATQWNAGQTFYIQLVGGAIDCVSVDSAIR